ncbi:MAG: RIP metalloprotease RseP [Sedimenticolaceae bacterium]
MEDFLFKILAFVVAVGLLVAIHEFGHFWVARRLGVKVLRFSIGFGRALWRRQSSPDEPEYVIAAIPLGGYVKMLDEHEGPVAPGELHRAFNRQSLWVRSAVVVAGPLFNFLFAIVAFWGVLVLGEPGIRPLIGEVEPGKAAARAELRVGDEIISVNGQITPTWSLALQELATASVGQPELRILVRGAGGAERVSVMPSGDIGDLAETRDLLGHLGLQPERPAIPPVFGKILAGEPAEISGLREGDLILTADGNGLADWGQWVKYVQARPGVPIDLVVEREGQSLPFTLTPAPYAMNETVIGRIGASNQPVAGLAERYRVQYRMGWGEAVPAAVGRTWEYSVLTLKVIWRVLTGEASIHNLSGPITIADAAGKTASIGFVYFLKFLAIVSISLGVLNLLPVPVLDGGHLLYFAIEAVKGSPVSEAAMVQGQKVGVLLLLSLMTLAFYVDILRILE